MSSNVRKHIAKNISKCDSPEVYQLNRWINTPLVNEKTIEEFFPHVNKLLEVTLNLESNIDDRIYVFKDRHYNFPVEFEGFYTTNTSTVFFLMSTPSNSDEYRQFVFSKESSKVIAYIQNEEITLVNSGDQLVFNKTQNNFTETVITLKELLSPSSTIEALNSYKFEIPISHDVLEYFYPKVTQISLLNDSMQLAPERKIPEKDIELLDKESAPKSLKLKNTVLVNDAPQLEYKNFTIASGEIYSLNTESISSNAAQGIIDEDLLADRTLDLNKLLEPVYELSEELQNEILNNIPRYYQAGAKFLYNTSHAILNDSPEYEKELQAVLALKMLLRVRAVKKVLILTNKRNFHKGSFLNKQLITGNWGKYLKTFLPDFAYTLFSEPKQLISKEQLNNSIIHVTTYQLLQTSGSTAKKLEKFYEKYDCVIFDDITIKLTESTLLDDLVSKTSTKFNWLLSDLDHDFIYNYAENTFRGEHFKKLRRDKTNLTHSDTRYFDYFIPLGGDNKLKVREQCNEFRESLDDILGIGNLFRFRPNLFSIFQNSQRQTNFIENNDTNKLDFLLDDLVSILHDYNRVLVYSQYAEDGITQIANFLDSKNIEYMLFTMSDTVKEIQQKIEKALNHSGNIVYLTNLKPSGIKFTFPNVSHIINFDNSWNPIERWQLEKKIRPINNEVITIINYYYTDTLEYKIRIDLAQKGFDVKPVIGRISSSVFMNMYNEKNWCDIFQIDTEMFDYNYKEEIIMENMKDLVSGTKTLATKLGYTNINISATGHDNTYTVTGNIFEAGEQHVLHARCIYTDNITTQRLQDLFSELDTYDKDMRIFIITNGTISNSNILTPENVLLIDGNQLSHYLKTL